MILEVNLQTLNEMKLTAHQYLLAKLISDNKIDTIEEYLKLTNSIETLPADMQALLDKGYIIPKIKLDDSYDFARTIVTHYFKKDVSHGDLYAELYNTYPSKVIRPNGKTDYLRTGHRQSKIFYTTTIHGNIEKHEHIINCLKAEVRDRELNGTMRFMPRLYKWLTSNGWLSYEDHLEDGLVQEVNNNGYGNEIE